MIYYCIVTYNSVAGIKVQHILVSLKPSLPFFTGRNRFRYVILFCDTIFGAMFAKKYLVCLVSLGTPALSAFRSFSLDVENSNIAPDGFLREYVAWPCYISH